MAKSMRKMLLLAKREVTPGVDPIPTAGANSVMVRGFTPELITAEFVQRNLLRPFKGNSGSMAVGVHRRFQFEIELAGSGAPGTAPAWGDILAACGFSETITVGISVQYLPVSEGEPTLTLYGYLDGVLFKLTNAKGTVSLQMDAKTIPVLKFDFIGAYSDGADVQQPAANTVDYSKFKQPQTVGKINTPTFSIYGVQACMQAFGVDVANQLAWRELVNCAGPRSPDRQPKGTAMIELTSMQQKNWGATIKDSVVGAAQIIHGTQAGNIIQLDLPNIQVTSAALQDQEGIAMLNLGFDVNPNTGDDEMVLTLK